MLKISNRSMNKFTLSSILLLLITLSLRGQDIHFSQFNNAPLLQNPALAGAISPLQLTLQYRAQWKSITIPYKTYAASADMRFRKRKQQTGFWAGGINLYNDQSGDGSIESTNANAIIAYHVSIRNHHTLGLGFQGGFGQRKMSMDGFQWGSQYSGAGYNGTLPTGESVSNPVFGYLDLSSGIVWSYDNQSNVIKVNDNLLSKGTLGFSVFHLNSPSYSFNRTGEKLHMKYVVHGNYLVSIPRSRFALNPGFMVYKQGPSSELLIGSMIRMNLISASKYTTNFKSAAASLGVFVRTKDAVVFSTLLEFSNYAIGFSYDLNTSTLSSAVNGRGGFEFSLRYIAHNRKVKSGL
jgi:type IX secretion system PorP/SprF family membrane protein